MLIIKVGKKKTAKILKRERKKSLKLKDQNEPTEQYRNPGISQTKRDMHSAISSFFWHLLVAQKKD